jgi:hypothetical protein
VKYNQHFAVALDQLLISVPQIDFKQNPDGIPSDTGAQIAGGSTASSAANLASLLRLGTLPVNLKRIALQPDPATNERRCRHQSSGLSEEMGSRDMVRSQGPRRCPRTRMGDFLVSVFRTGTRSFLRHRAGTSLRVTQ